MPYPVTYHPSVVTLADLKAHVGEALFHEACWWAWKTAIDTPHAGVHDVPWPEEVGDVPHELVDLIWLDPDVPPAERVRLHFELYREMPCYANLMYADGEFDELSSTDLGMFWFHVRSLLDDPDDRLATPVMYWLWCGPFEGSHSTSAVAWAGVTTGVGLGGRGLGRAVKVSGPVPWDVKAPLLGRLARAPQWQAYVLDALVDAVQSIYGKLEAREALAILDGLSLSGGDLETAAQVRSVLEHQ